MSPVITVSRASSVVVHDTVASTSHLTPHTSHPSPWLQVQAYFEPDWVGALRQQVHDFLSTAIEAREVPELVKIFANAGNTKTSPIAYAHPHQYTIPPHWCPRTLSPPSIYTHFAAGSATFIELTFAFWPQASVCPAGAPARAHSAGHASVSGRESGAMPQQDRHPPQRLRALRPPGGNPRRAGPQN